MLRIFADDIQSALALDNLALRAALANGGTYFHDDFLLTSFVQPKSLIILVPFFSVQFRLCLCWLVTGQSGREGRLR